MRKNIFLSVMICLAFWLKTTTIDSSTKKTIRVDNDYIHTYNEKQGRWVILLETPYSLKTLLKMYDTTEEEVRQINGFSKDSIISLRNPFFIPYGDSYLQSLIAEGKGRDEVTSDYRDFLWPVGTVNAKISSKLGKRNKTMHTGIDIACPHRSPIIAAADGEVTMSQYNGNYGYVIFIQHDLNQILTLYAHNSYLLVKKGDKVKKGQIIALSGSTGHSTGPHLHFEVRYQNIVLNPEHYLYMPTTHTASDSSSILANEENL
ncbi:MAG: M23 family metallopeptidase [Leptospiraceae bacterium]|nr:M23 family metallopeptidase [Leptospiraceae bacterium]MCP5510743.1 M23 family metallopeptidase [Leptospiraceae bacterium]